MKLPEPKATKRSNVQVGFGTILHDRLSKVEVNVAVKAVRRIKKKKKKKPNPHQYTQYTVMKDHLQDLDYISRISEFERLPD